MKNKIIPLIVAIFILLIVGCIYMLINSQKNTNTNTNNNVNNYINNDSNSSSKALVAYYSLTGTTKKVASKLAEKTGGDLFEITPVNAYPTDHDDCAEIALREKNADARPELKTHVSNMEDYDIIFVGYPIWYYTAPMLIRTFIEEYDLKDKVVIPFCTSGGYGIEESVTDIRKITDANVLDGMRFRTSSDSAIESDIDKWFESIGLNNILNKTAEYKETTKVILTINNKDISAVLNDSPASKDLISRLPLTISLSEGSRDYCGGINPPLNYQNSDVHNGYKNGDLAFWVTGNDFVIFTKRDETANEVSGVVSLGRITDDIEVFNAMDSSFNVTIKLAD